VVVRRQRVNSNRLNICMCDFPNFPNLPNFPNFPNLPNFPNFPNLPNFPQFPQFTQFPHFPQLPQLPHPLLRLLDLLTTVASGREEHRSRIFSFCSSVVQSVVVLFSFLGSEYSYRLIHNFSQSFFPTYVSRSQKLVEHDVISVRLLD